MGASGILLFDYMLELWLNLLLYIQIAMIIRLTDMPILLQDTFNLHSWFEKQFQRVFPLRCF